jgi:hypothetical protein
VTDDHLHHGNGIDLEAIRDVLARLDDDEFTERYGKLVLLMAAGDLARTLGKPGTQEIAPDPGVGGPLKFRVFPVKKTGNNQMRHVTVGRTRNNDVWIDDGTISKFHAFFVVDVAGAHLYDAESAHGTKVNDTAAPKRGDGAPIDVRSKDALQLGGLNTTVLSVEDLRAFLKGLGY